MKEQSKSSLSLGSLIVDCQICTACQIEYAVQFANLAGIPLGKALCFLEFANSNQIEDTLEAQSLVSNKIISREEAIFVLQTAAKFKLRFAQALALCSIDPQDRFSTRIGYLLKLQGICPSKVNEALKVSKESGKQIGQIALQTEIISSERLEYTLKIQKTIRSLSAPLVEPKENQNNSFCRIGELLIKARCINEKMLEKALDEKDLAQQQLGTYLLSQNLINDSLLHLAICLQNLVRNGHLNFHKAIKSLNGFAFDQSQMSVGQFLTICNYYNQEDEEKLITMLDQNSSLYKEILKALTHNEMVEYCDSGMLLKLAYRNTDVMRLLLHLLRPEDQIIIDKAIAFHSLAKEKKMSFSQALINCMTNKLQMENSELMVA